MFFNVFNPIRNTFSQIFHQNLSRNVDLFCYIETDVKFQLTEKSDKTKKRCSCLRRTWWSTRIAIGPFWWGKHDKVIQVTWQSQVKYRQNPTKVPKKTWTLVKEWFKLQCYQPGGQSFRWPADLSAPERSIPYNSCQISGKFGSFQLEFMAASKLDLSWLEVESVSCCWTHHSLLNN